MYQYYIGEMKQYAHENQIPRHKQVIKFTCTVWKLASVTIGLKSKNMAKNNSNLEFWVIIERDDFQECFDTRFHYISFLALNDKAKEITIQINQKASIQSQIKVSIFSNINISRMIS